MGLLTVIFLVFGTNLALSQSAPPAHQQLQKTIGQAKPDIVPSLIVLNAQGATLDGNTLRLTDVASNAIVFADRPVRSAGHAMTSDLLEEWSYDDSFAKDPPNATVSAFSADGGTIWDAVVVLKSPKRDGSDLTFDVDVLEGSLGGTDGPAAVFIDIIGLPRTPVSFAGAARRTAYRGAFYKGAAVGAAAGAAVGAAAAAPYYRPACGYYPYPPCH
jgi:hypothetical protein